MILVAVRKSTFVALYQLGLFIRPASSLAPPFLLRFLLVLLPPLTSGLGSAGKNAEEINASGHPAGSTVPPHHGNFLMVSNAGSTVPLIMATL